MPLGTRRPSTLDAPLSPSALPDFTILPQPLPSAAVTVGQLVNKTSKFEPSGLHDRDYDDVGTRWYKDVIIFNSDSGLFVESLGAAHLIQKPTDGQEAGTIEADEQRARLLKDPEAALQKVLAEPDAGKWMQQNKDAGFVVGTREVTNASYRRARLVDRGNGNWEVVRDVGQSGEGKRRDSGLEVNTGSKKDVIGVVVRRVVADGGNVRLGEEMTAAFWE